MACELSPRERRWLIVSVAFLATIRLATLGAYPLLDPTESRYAEIARKMLETGDWLMPQFEYGVPFWGKPPLSTWLTASSIAVFGVDEFAARIPSLLLIAACAAMVWLLARLRGGRDQALWTLPMFAAMGLVFIAAGSVMTDPALVFGTTLAMTGFWLAVEGGTFQRIGSVAFFAAMAVGLLAKGPIAVLLTMGPILCWSLAAGRMEATWRNVPWWRGGIVVALLVVPWYWAAERATPGFLDYFLVGEHWKRFVEPGWKGDLYGAAHAQHHGMIWLFWFEAALPWSPGALAWLASRLRRRQGAIRMLAADPWRLYLVLWAIFPMLLFTLSGNVLATYVLPGLPAFALLVGDLWQPVAGDARAVRLPVRVVTILVLVVTVTLGGTMLALGRWYAASYSQSALIAAYEAARASVDVRLVYFEHPPPSAAFYSEGRAIVARTATDLERELSLHRQSFVALHEPNLATVRAAHPELAIVGAFGEYRLLHAAPR
jgi:4-amino-4-deoxy-L-arabinose transferase-like glycosyltransferase